MAGISPRISRNSAAVRSPAVAAETHIVAKSYRTDKPESGAAAVSNKKSCAYAGCAALGLP